MNRVELLSSLKLIGYGIEVGVQAGVYAEHILQNTDLHLICLDGWRHIPHGYKDRANGETETHLHYMNSTIRRLYQKYEGRFSVMRELSEKACIFFKDEMFDFIYLDSNHSEIFVTEQLYMWWNKLKTGGVIAGHDYLNLSTSINDFGVKAAVDNFVNANNLILNLTTENSFKSWYIFKP